MRRQGRQKGSVLVMVIGLTAALALLSAALVPLLWNTRHATSTEVTQVKAFNVAEAGLDAGEQALFVAWPSPPSPSEPAPTPSVDPVEFQKSFPSYPDPVSGSAKFIDVKFYDDDNNQANWGIRRQYGYDENNNHYMWIEARAATGSRKAEVMALVQEVDYTPPIMPGVVLATTALFTASGTGNQPVIGLDTQASPSVYVGTYDFTGQPKFQDDNMGTVQNPPTQGTTDETLRSIFPDDFLLYLVGVAHGAGKEYATSANVPSAAWVSDPRIIVIDSGNLDLGNVQATDTGPTGTPCVWTQEHPGILIVRNGNFTNVGHDGKSLYGLVYVNGDAELGGNAEVHGMLVTRGAQVRMHGTRALDYNANVFNILSRTVPLSVKLVPNTWREIPTN